MSPFRSALAAFGAVLTFSGWALADHGTIKSEYDHPRYVFEAEPHFVVTPFHDGGVGAGFAGTFNVADRGFIRRLNDSVGVGFAANWTTNEHLFLSGAMQWNFWFTERWSAFGEPGVAITTDKFHLWPHIGVGGRFALAPNITLTLRLGFPASSVGVSFLL
ncbi:MAG TPA: hypothetical protein VF103_05745 [Polyangiaceae bacterium]